MNSFQPKATTRQYIQNGIDVMLDITDRLASISANGTSSSSSSRSSNSPEEMFTGGTTSSLVLASTILLNVGSSFNTASLALLYCWSISRVLVHIFGTPCSSYLNRSSNLFLKIRDTVSSQHDLVTTEPCNQNLLGRQVEVLVLLDLLPDLIHINSPGVDRDVPVVLVFEELCGCKPVAKKLDIVLKLVWLEMFMCNAGELEIKEVCDCQVLTGLWFTQRGPDLVKVGHQTIGQVLDGCHVGEVTDHKQK
ncbi:hypothetical protein OGAPHI_001849 [Ogataea philodendri]|uniref:Uncharacterized protein n=1 Tax=Ogataea philodendri TaxID=1378263 RepID=A0A9P8PAP3_9ASCO|nr:uncharacterized protein OGAPHI_001849 [Ogataea philodendri]KAH3668095.1 hypothetical protein OGAPHI_001849 [Ogataea philodendri]